MKSEDKSDAFYEGGMFFRPGFGIAEWEALKSGLSVGSIILGKVVHQAPFGVFYDAGLGFPVLIRVPDFGKPEGGMVFPDDYPNLSSEISGQFCGFDDGNRQLIVCRLGIKL